MAARTMSAPRVSRRGAAHPIGTTYLIHMEGRVAEWAGHYLGWTRDVEWRLEEHRNGRGSPLLAAAAERGIPFNIVRLWPNTTRAFERKLHETKNSPCLCPVCRTQLELFS